MSPRQPSPDWLPLGAELRKLRSLAGLTTREVAARTGLSNARASRIETGLSILSMPELDAWADVVGIDGEARGRLHRLTERAYSPEVEDFEPEEGVAFEREYGEVEATAQRLITIARVIPGLLQTPDYAAAIMRLGDPTGTRDIAASVAERMERSTMLFRGDKTFMFIMSEADLRIGVGGPRVMAAQYDRIGQLSRLKEVKVGIVPMSDGPTALLVNDASLLLDRIDDEPPLVYLETTHGGVWIRQPKNVQKYVDHADRLWRGALVGDDARALLARLTLEGN